MTDVLFANNASSDLASAITASATVITVQSGDAAEFPSPDAGEWFPITVVDPSGNREIMYCTDRTGANLTVTRGQEGTTAIAFAAGAIVELRLTAGALEAIQADTTNVNAAGALMDSEVDADLKTLTLPANTTISDAGAALIDDADAATQRATLGLGNVDNTSDAAKPVSTAQQAALNGKVPTTRTVSAGTGLTGGGALSANRTISANVATQAEAEAGTSSAKLMTPQRTAQAIDALASRLGVGQSWQDVTGSRAVNTSYQNTTGQPIMVHIGQYASHAKMQVSANNSTWIEVGRDVAGTDWGDSCAIVPTNHYYRLSGSGHSFSVWTELR